MLLAIAEAGLFSLTPDDEHWRCDLLRPGARQQCAACDPGNPSVIYVGGRGSGVHKSSDAGRSWHDLSLPLADVFSVAVCPADGALYAGTEPSHLFQSRDGGASWQELTALTKIPSAPSWSFPPRPWTSHVRAIAPHPRDARLLLAGIELGGLMRSEDGGATWADHASGAQRDVHALAWHPRDAARAYEAGGGGAAWSFDAGRTWHPADAGRDRNYTWALAVDPENPDLWYISASTGARYAHSRNDAQAHIYRWSGAGPWKKLDRGLPEPLASMPYALLATRNAIFAGLADGRIFTSRDHGDTWSRLQVRGQALRGLRVLTLCAPL